jgi:hypothetical protein
MKWNALGAAFVRMLLWILGILLLIHLITWMSAEQNGAPTVPDWAEIVVWGLFIVPIVPAMIAGVTRLQGPEKWKPVLLGLIFGVLTPIFGIAGLIATFLLIGGNVDIGPHDESISDGLILLMLFSTVIVLGVGSALLRHNSLRNN